jgi:hypothetical protein
MSLYPTADRSILQPFCQNYYATGLSQYGIRIEESENRTPNGFPFLEKLRMRLAESAADPGENGVEEVFQRVHGEEPRDPVEKESEDAHPEGKTNDRRWFPAFVMPVYLEDKDSHVDKAKPGNEGNEGEHCVDNEAQAITDEAENLAHF